MVPRVSSLSSQQGGKACQITAGEALTAGEEIRAPPRKPGGPVTPVGGLQQPVHHDRQMVEVAGSSPTRGHHRRLLRQRPYPRLDIQVWGTEQPHV